MTIEMFKDKPYSEVNREERAYCALFAHALLASPVTRYRFAVLTAGRLKVQLNPDHVEVFVEVAALRDYWADLGNPRSYTEETDRRRLAVLRGMLSLMKVPPDLINDHGFFRTSGPKNKLWNPGRWLLPKVGSAGIDQYTLERLQRLKWAFNSKPDMLILSDKASLLIEAKIESGESKYGDTKEPAGATRDLVAQLLNNFVPEFRRAGVHPCTLELRGANGYGARRARRATFTWAEVEQCCETLEVDEFTRKCLSTLTRYGPGRGEKPAD